MRLEGKVAIISGGARGQGAAEARMFAREGAAVVFGDILDEEGLKLEAEIRELGGRATYIHLDVTEPEQWENAVSRAVSEYGKLDILVNNAGIGSVATGGLDAPKIDGTPTELWDRIAREGAAVVFGDIPEEGLKLEREQQGGVPRHQNRYPGHAGGGRWFHHKYFLHCWYGRPLSRQRRRRCVRSVQGFCAASHQVDRGSIWGRRHKVQFGPSGVHRDGHD